MSERDDLGSARRLRQAVHGLPRQVDPGRDLWPEIAAGLEKSRPEKLAGRWWRLAAAVLLVAGGLVTALLLRPGAPSAGTRAAAETGAAEAGPIGPPMAAAHLRQRDGVLHAHNDLVAAIAWRRASVDAAGEAALMAGLAALERATADIEAALAENPSDRYLRLALAASYRREAEWSSRLRHV